MSGSSPAPRRSASLLSSRGSGKSSKPLETRDTAISPPLKTPTMLTASTSSSRSVEARRQSLGKNQAGKESPKDRRNGSDTSSKVLSVSVTEEQIQIELLQLQKTKALEEENEALKKKLAVLQAILEDEKDDPSKLTTWRLRVLKAQNLELEHRVAVYKGSLTLAKEARAGLQSLVTDFHAKVKEFQSAERVPEPPARRKSDSATPGSSRMRSPSSSPSLKAVGSPSKGSSPGPLSPKPPSSVARFSLSSKPGPAPSGSPKALSRAATSGAAPSRSTSIRSSSNSGQLAGGGNKLVAEAAVDEPPVPKVVVPIDWLEHMDRWTKEFLDRLAKTPADVEEGDRVNGVLPATITGQPGKPRGFDVALFQANINPFLSVDLVPKVDQVEEEDEESITPKAAKEIAASLNLNKVHELEVQLSEIHPGLVLTAGLLRSVILPSLPSHTAETLVKELESVNVLVHSTAKALSQLALLVPGKSSLFNATIVGPHPGATTAGEHNSRFAISHSPKLPSVDDFLAVLPADQRDEFQGKLENLVQQIQSVEAAWKSEIQGLQDELVFFQGCHAINAAHVKTITQSAKDTLKSIIGNAVEVSGEAAAAVKEIIETFSEYEAEPSLETGSNVTKKVHDSLPVLNKFLELLPPDLLSEPGEQLSSEKTDAVVDPLEKEYKDKLKDLFDTLQSTRNVKYRQRTMSPSKAARASTLKDRKL